jgi:hypothetical protein
MYISPDHSPVSMVTIKIKLNDDSQETLHPQTGGFPFCQLYDDLKYRRGESITDFYNQYRNHVMASVMKQEGEEEGESIPVLSVGEQLSPCFEDLILANVLRRIDVRLPRRVRSKYRHLIGRTKGLMDYKSEILAAVPTFLAQLENNHHSPAAENDEKHPAARCV